jgi:hypothetical protein
MTEVAERVLERAVAFRGSHALPVQKTQAQLAAAAVGTAPHTAQDRKRSVSA